MTKQHQHHQHPLLTDAQSRKRNRTCKPHSHGRHQPPTTPPTPERRSNTHERNVEGRHSAARIFLRKQRKNHAKCPHPPPQSMHKTQNKKRNTTHNPHSHRRHQPTPSPPPSPPIQKPTREAQHGIRIRMDVISPPPQAAKKRCEMDSSDFWYSAAPEIGALIKHRKNRMRNTNAN